MGKTYIIDVADVTTTRNSDNMTVFTGSATTTGLNISAESETQRGGHGNKSLFRYAHSKEVTLNIIDALFNANYLAMSQGVAIEEGEETITRTEKDVEVKQDGEDLELEITGSPKGSTAVLVNSDNESEEVDVSSGSITVPKDFAKAGDKVTVLYKEDVEGKVIKIDAAKFGESYTVQYHTLEYDTVTNRVVKDIYFVFENVVPDSEFEMSFEAGEPIAPEINFEALASGDSDQIGYVIEVSRKDTP